MQGRIYSFGDPGTIKMWNILSVTVNLVYENYSFFSKLDIEVYCFLPFCTWGTGRRFTIRFRIWEVQSSNSCRDAGYFNVLMTLLSYPRQVWMKHLAARHDHFILHSFGFEFFIILAPSFLIWQSVWSIKTIQLIKRCQMEDPYFITIHNIASRPNMVVDWMAFLLHIRKFPGSELRPKNEYSDWGVYPYPFSHMLRQYLKLAHDLFLLHIFHFIIH